MQAKRMAAMLSTPDYAVLDEKGGFCRWRSKAAAERSLDAGDLVTVRGEEGSVTAKLRFDDTLSPGTLHLTHGWIGRNVCQLVSPEIDPQTGQPVMMSAIPVEIAAAS